MISRDRLIQYTFAGLLAIGLLTYLWKEHLEDRFIPKRWGVVETGSIYRSGQLHPALIESVLEEYNIEVIVDLNDKKPNRPAQDAEDAVAIALAIDKKRYPLNGNGTGNIRQYAKAITRVHKAVIQGDPVLVHCAAGTQRTGGVIAMYRVLVQGKSVDFAVAEMERYDWDPEEDHILLEYMDAHMEELAMSLVASDVIDSLPLVYPSFLTSALKPR